MTGIGEELMLPPTKRYNTNQTCSILGIHRNTLRKKTVEGRIKCSYRKEGSRLYPVYLGRDIVKFWRELI